MKGLVIDGVDKAKSGHPGGAMSSMDFASILFSEFLNFDPADPEWQGRDKFILSAGHESMLAYALLHGLNWVNLKDLQEFRQWGSRTPGHPENLLTPGIECTTGPLGQGCAMSLGFAAASKHMAAACESDLFLNRTWVLLGDGCMQEGVTYGAASMAGHLKLDNLVWYYDRNAQQISGSIDKTYSDQTQKIYEGLGWEVVAIDGHDHQAIRAAIEKALKNKGKPFLIIGNTVMAKGSFSMEASHKTHGAPLPADERQKTKQKLGIPENESFFWPLEAQAFFQRRFPNLSDHVASWKKQLADKKRTDPKWAEKIASYFTSPAIDKLPAIKWDQSKSLATRNAFGEILEAWAEHLPNLMGGSADLEPSNMTGAFAKKVGDFSWENPQGRNINFGVREFPMSAMANGLALAGGIIPFDATFLSFSDYSRPALRLGALQKCQVIHEFTHDSFYLGEDGPTHQPVEHIMSLRQIPDFYVMRPADSQECEILFKKALTIKAPSAFCLTRQKLNYLNINAEQAKSIEKGAWTVCGEDQCDLIIFASGSEVHLALQTLPLLQQSSKFKKIKLVSIPSWELFFEQQQEYKDRILSLECENRVSIEAGTSLGWEKFIGINGLSIGMNQFGASAPAAILEEKYGFTPKQVYEKISNFFS